MMLPLAICAFIVALFLSGLGRENPDELPSTRIGLPAPVLSTAPLGAKTNITDADLRAKGVKLVNFWASWCGPCRAEHPNLETLKARGVPVYGVNYKDDPANALAFLAELGDPYRKVGQDRTGRQAIDWGVYGVPETFVIDGAGNVVLRFPGPITARVLDATILPAIRDAATDGVPEY